MKFEFNFTQALISVFLVLTAFAQPVLGADVLCPPMPDSVTTIARDVKSDISASMGALGKVKAGELAVKTEVTAKNLFAKYPNLDKLLLVQTMSATYCRMLNTSALDDREKLRRWESYQSKILNLDGNSQKGKGTSPRSENRSDQPTQNLPAAQNLQATVVKLGKIPKIDDQDAEALEKKLIPWFAKFMFETQIIVDKGSKQGVREGDYFYIVEDEQIIKSTQNLSLGRLITSGSELKVVLVDEAFSVCQLEEFAYENYFQRLSAVLASDGSPKKPLEETLSLVRVGQRAVLIPPAERSSWSDFSKTYNRAVHGELPAEEKATSMAVAIGRAEGFISQFPTGYFTPSALFNIGFLQYELRKYRASIDTFESFLLKYPFHLSASGAREWIAKARDQLRTVASNESPSLAASSASTR